MKTAIDRIKKELAAMLDEHEEDLKSAWLKLDEEEKLTISLPVKLSMDKGQAVCEVGISFVAERVKDSIAFTWDDRQLRLGLGK